MISPMFEYVWCGEFIHGPFRPHVAAVLDPEERGPENWAGCRCWGRRRGKSRGISGRQLTRKEDGRQEKDRRTGDM